MTFVEKTLLPSDLKEGSIVKAQILDVSRVTSRFKDNEGNPKEQLRFDLELENGYKFKAWIAFYEHPSDKSKLGKLALKFIEKSGKKPDTVTEFLDALKQFGYVFVKCKGYREYEEEFYPNFSIVTESIPEQQHQEERTQPMKFQPATKQYNPKTLLAKFKEAIYFGLPLNQNDWSGNLLVQERIFLLKQGFVEMKRDLYFFTNKTRALFHQQSNL